MATKNTRAKTHTRSIGSKTDLSNPIERKPRRGRLMGSVPAHPRVEAMAAAGIVGVVLAVGLFGPVPRPIDWVLVGLAVVVAVGVLWVARQRSQDPATAWVRNLGYAAKAVGFKEDLVLCAGPQLALIKLIPAGPVRITRMGEVQISGKPLHRIVPSREAATLAKAWGGEIEVIVAVEDTETAVEAAIVPLGKSRQAVMVGRSEVAGVVLGLPERLDEDVDPVEVVEAFLGQHRAG